MMGINGPGRRINEEELRQLWSDPATGADLRRIGIEVPSQLGALFLMDGEEIDRITRERRATDGQLSKAIERCGMG